MSRSNSRPAPPDFTPGPWSTNGYGLVTRNGGAHVVAFVRGGGDDAVTLANSRLIAAAPDLLDALRELVAHEDERIAKNGEDWALTPVIRKRTAKARAAIAAATGSA